MTWESAWLVQKVKKKHEQNILNILVSTYKFSHFLLFDTSNWGQI